MNMTTRNFQFLSTIVARLVRQERPQWRRTPLRFLCLRRHCASVVVGLGLPLSSDASAAFLQDLALGRRFNELSCIRRINEAAARDVCIANPAVQLVEPFNSCSGDYALHMCNARNADIYWGGFLVNQIFSLGDIGYIQLSLDNTSQDDIMCSDSRPSPIPSLKETLLSMVFKISLLSNSQLSVSNFTAILLFNCQNASLVNHGEMCNRYLSLPCNKVQTSCIEFELSEVISNLSIISKCQHSELVIRDHGLMDKNKISVGMVEFQWQMGGFKNIEVNCEKTNIEDQHRSSKKSLKIVGIVVPIGVVAVLAAAFYICRQWPNVLRISMSNGESGVQLPSIVSDQPEQIEYEVLNRATSSFGCELGSGAHGRVYKGIMQDDTQIAVKVLDATSAHTEKEFRTEMATLSSISHINVVRLIGFCIENERRFIVYELVENGSLDKWIFHDRVLKWPQRYAIAMDVARGLAYLHEECRHEIVHCDIKPQNILLDGKFNAKIADFGIAKLIA